MTPRVENLAMLFKFLINVATGTFELAPVVFFPATPVDSGSYTPAKTIGISDVSRITASVAGAPYETITSEPIATSFLAEFVHDIASGVGVWSTISTRAGPNPSEAILSMKALWTSL